MGEYKTGERPPAAKHGQVCGKKCGWRGPGWDGLACPLLSPFWGTVGGGYSPLPPLPAKRHSSVSAKNGRPQLSATCDPYWSVWVLSARWDLVFIDLSWKMARWCGDAAPPHPARLHKMAALVAPATLYRLTVETPVLPKTCHICRPPSSLPNFRPAFVVSSLKSGTVTRMLYLEPQWGGQQLLARQGSSWFFLSPARWFPSLWRASLAWVRHRPCPPQTARTDWRAAGIRRHFDDCWIQASPNPSTPPP